MAVGNVKRIMIVDDEATVLLGLSCVLKTESVEVVTCNGIEQAKELLKITDFDLVLTDIRMSGVHGIEGLELLSYIKRLYDNKVIIMTGCGNDEVEADAYRRGAYYYFNKPIDTKELLFRVSEAGIPTKIFV